MSTRSSSITLTRPAVSSRLKITNRSFTHQAPVLWDALPRELRQPVVHSSQPDILYSTVPPILELSTSQFHSISSKLISSKNHFPLSLFYSPMSSSGSLKWLMYISSLFHFIYIQPLSFHFICFTAYVSTQCLGISLHHFPFSWLAFAGTLNLLTHFTHHLSQLYILSL